MLVVVVMVSVFYIIVLCVCTMFLGRLVVFEVYMMNRLSLFDVVMGGAVFVAAVV